MITPIKPGNHSNHETGRYGNGKTILRNREKLDPMVKHHNRIHLYCHLHPPILLDLTARDAKCTSRNSESPDWAVHRAVLSRSISAKSETIMRAFRKGDIAALQNWTRVTIANCLTSKIATPCSSILLASGYWGGSAPTSFTSPETLISNRSRYQITCERILMGSRRILITRINEIYLNFYFYYQIRILGVWLI
jgi:hypothetical protein